MMTCSKLLSLIIDVYISALESVPSAIASSAHILLFSSSNSKPL